MRAIDATGHGGDGVASAAEGLALGALATLPMSGVMWAAQRAGAMGRMPPRKIADAAARLRLRRRSHPLTATALHLAFGAAAGAVYALATRRLERGPGSGTGIAFGLLLWAASYAGWIPAVGIMPPPRRDRPGRPTSMIAAHVAYGATLGAGLSARLRGRTSGGTRGSARSVAGR